MKIDRKKLVSELARALPGISVGTVKIEGADTFVFKGGHIYTYNSVISVDSDCDMTVLSDALYALSADLNPLNPTVLAYSTSFRSAMSAANGSVIPQTYSYGVGVSKSASVYVKSI